MTSRKTSPGRSDDLSSSALKVNLERTAATIEIPARYSPLLQVTENHYGLQKKTRDLLTELNHPYVNWEYVLKELKSVSIGDFHIFNRHPDGFAALEMILNIYFEVIRSSTSCEVRDSAIHYLFDYVDTILTQSAEQITRNLPILSAMIQNLNITVDQDELIFKKASSYIKRIIRTIMNPPLLIDTQPLIDITYKIFRITYRFWCELADPYHWLSTEEGETQASVDAYRRIIEPLSHDYLRALLEKLERLHQNTSVEKEFLLNAYLELPDYFQIVNGYLSVADQLEKSEAHTGRQHVVKLRFLFHVMDNPGLTDIHTGALREINHSLKLVFQEEKKNF